MNTNSINPAPVIDETRLVGRTQRSATAPSKLLQQVLAAHPQWARNREAFLEMLPGLLQTHRNRFVAIHDGRVVGVGGDAGEAAEQALALVGQVEMYVDEVTDTPRLYRVRGPRIARSEASR